jgi:hypothetical protein
LGVFLFSLLVLAELRGHLHDAAEAGGAAVGLDAVLDFLPAAGGVLFAEGLEGFAVLLGLVAVGIEPTAVEPTAAASAAVAVGAVPLLLLLRLWRGIGP